MITRSNARSLHWYRRPCLTILGSYRESAAIIGHNVSAVSAESTTATDTVTPNSRNSRPMMPPMNNSGMKTAINETVIGHDR